MHIWMKWANSLTCGGIWSLSKSRRPSIETLWLRGFFYCRQIRMLILMNWYGLTFFLLGGNMGCRSSRVGCRNTGPISRSGKAKPSKTSKSGAMKISLNLETVICILIYSLLGGNILITILYPCWTPYLMGWYLPVTHPRYHSIIFFTHVLRNHYQHQSYYIHLQRETRTYDALLRFIFFCSF